MANESGRKRTGTAFEVPLGDEPATVTGVGPARLRRKTRRSPVTAEKLEAKLRQAEERRKAHERARLERIHQRTQQCQRIHKLASKLFEYQNWYERRHSKHGHGTITEEPELTEPEASVKEASCECDMAVAQSTQTEGGNRLTTAVQATVRTTTEATQATTSTSDHSGSDSGTEFESASDLSDAAYFRFLYAGLQRSLSRDRECESPLPGEQATQTLPLDSITQGTQASTSEDETQCVQSSESRESSSQTDIALPSGARPKLSFWSEFAASQSQRVQTDSQVHCCCCRCLPGYQGRDVAIQTVNTRPMAFEVALEDNSVRNLANVPDRIRRLGQRRGSSSEEELAAKLQKAEERKKMMQQARITRIKQREAECLRVDYAVCRLLQIETTVVSHSITERPIRRTEAMSAIKDIVMGMGKIGAELQRDIDFAKTLPSYSPDWSPDESP